MIVLFLCLIFETRKEVSIMMQSHNYIRRMLFEYQYYLLLKVILSII
jgi:hypothetical protein